MYLRVKSLPKQILDALNHVGYHKADIRIEVTENFCPRPPSADGRRGYCAAVNLIEGAEKPFDVVLGSWGGSNMFVKTVDDFDDSVPIPNDCAFITGMISSGTSYPATGTIWISPSNMNPSLLPPVHSVNEREAKILAIVRSLKSAYRKEYLERMKATTEEIDGLVARKFLSKNKAGAMSITTDGRNAAAKNYY